MLFSRININFLVLLIYFINCLPPNSESIDVNPHILFGKTALNGDFRMGPSRIQISHSVMEEESIPTYEIKFNEGNFIDTWINSDQLLTLNLNRVLPSNITVYIRLDQRDNLAKLKNNPSLFNVSETSAFATFLAGQSGDIEVNYQTNDKPGYLKIIAKVYNKTTDVDDSMSFVEISVGRDKKFITLSQIFGWSYFIAWSLSFYPQIVMNFKRKSVVGLHFDFLSLNIFGFSCYLIYNSVMLYSPLVHDLYHQKYLYSRIPVEMNDFIFTLHAVVVTLIVILQCSIYDRGQQQVSNLVIVLIVGLSLGGLVLYILSLFDQLSLLTSIYYFSYLKVLVSFIKYVPQAIYNIHRSSTEGWSIHNILLDFLGGILSIGQMIVLAYNYNDWVQIFGNSAKFALGLLCVGFDILFMIQHYILYPKPLELDGDNINVPTPIISQSIQQLDESQPRVINHNVANDISFNQSHEVESIK